MPDSIQFSVTKAIDGTFKVLVQDEKNVLRIHEPSNINALFDIMDDEVNQLRPVND